MYIQIYMYTYIYVYICIYCEMNTYTDHQRQHDNLYCRLPFHTCQGSITNMHPAVLQTRGCGQPWVEAGAVCLSHKASRSRTINFLCCGQHPISSSSEILTWHSSGRHKTRSVTLALGFGTFCSDSFVAPTSVNPIHNIYIYNVGKIIIYHPFGNGLYHL